MGFDEARQQKEVLLVDLGADGLTAITPLVVPRFQPLISVSGNLIELGSAITDGLIAQPLLKGRLRNRFGWK